MEEERLFRVLTNRAEPGEATSVAAWRREAAENERIFRELADVLAVTKAVDRPPESVAPAALRLIHAAGPRVADSAPGRSWGSAQRSLQRWSWLAVAAAVVAVLVSGVWDGRWSGPITDELNADEFVTGPSETATLTLRDGTVVRLAPNSRLRLMAGRQGRRVTLHGQAFFAVAKDPARQFVIETSSGRVEVLGTRFDIQAGDGGLRVLVVEGRVTLSGRGGRNEVRAGELGRIVEGTTLRPIAVPNLSDRERWMGTFLAFQETPLREAAREIEQLYAVRIEITDPHVGLQTITTWFADQPIEKVMEVFCMVAEARCTTQGDVIRVESKWKN